MRAQTRIPEPKNKNFIGLQRFFISKFLNFVFFFPFGFPLFFFGCGRNISAQKRNSQLDILCMFFFFIYSTRLYQYTGQPNAKLELDITDRPKVIIMNKMKKKKNKSKENVTNQNADHCDL